jgi:hypothetical protein
MMERREIRLHTISEITENCDDIWWEDSNFAKDKREIEKSNSKRKRIPSKKYNYIEID